MAVVDYIDNDGEPPPELLFYIHTRDHGDPWGKGWMAWPPQSMSELAFVGNVYNAWRAYRMADNPVQWLNSHKEGAVVVGEIKSLLYAREPEIAMFERWEQADGDAGARDQWQRVTGR